MTSIDITEPKAPERKRSGWSENLALPAMVVVAVFIGVLLNQAGAQLVTSVLTGLLSLAVFWFAHAARARGRRVSELQREIGRMGVELHRLRAFGRGAAPPTPDYLRGKGMAQTGSLAKPVSAAETRGERPAAAPVSPSHAAPSVTEAMPSPQPAALETERAHPLPPLLQSPAMPAPAAADPSGKVAGNPAPEPERRDAVAARSSEGDFTSVLAAELSHEVSLRHGTEPHMAGTPVAPAAGGMQPDPWSYRPTAVRDLPMETASHEAGPPLAADRSERIEPHLEAPGGVTKQKPAAPSGAAVGAGVGARDLDVEAIQSLIKKLADEVSAAERADGRMPGAAAPAIESSLDALRVTADTMREAVQAQGFGRRTAPPRATQPHPSQAPAGLPPPVGPMHARLAALAEAINVRRADVLLEPILGLEDHRPRHYEVSLRLRGADGSVLETDGMLDTLRETELLAMLDATRLARTAQVARALKERGKTGAVFSEIDSGSLTRDQFIREFRLAYGERDAYPGQLVLSLAQSDVRRFTRRDWAMIEDMRELGYQFALRDVTDLDVDFESLRGHGFVFAKLDASVFLEGLPTSGGFIPASDICRHLAELGLTLIVGAIDDPMRLAQIFGFGVLYGQGQLFGGPRPMRAEALASAVRPTSGGMGAGHAAA